MRLAIDDICAVIVTRGNVDLEPILGTLPYSEVIVWDDRERGSQGCYGRYLAAEETTRPVIYFQDDDVIFTAHRQLLSHYAPCRMTVNMPSPWYENGEYDLIQQALVGAGSLVDRGLPNRAISLYLDRYPLDQLFLDYCDIVVGILTPHLRLDLGYEVMAYASSPGRIFTKPGSQERKAEMQRRMLEFRAEQERMAA